ncbi:ROK family transcriptional regulator [Ciceribacter sp. L1K22]|uniref:ROK family transcriptional regulator n=1 Tax=Ciceribacter sp. L1K22 TaxID=2820275 RepID=UPI001ABDC469|nr:ROK family transcriptional regulator [Ciceribacter sp. L1K22]MBO3758396.1 ROK family transcriptional regulator [Ciceribacter sp. L1K22]
MLAKSSTELVRQQNSHIVLRALRLHGRLSHTEISDFTGLASATVSAITADLERAGIIEKSEQKPLSGRGRPRVLFTQRRGHSYLVVVIISSDVVQYSLADYSGTLIDRFTETRVAGGVGTFMEGVQRALERMIERNRVSPSAVRSISISSKGLVDSSAPVLLWSPVLGTERVDFQAGLSPRWPARILLSNETLLVARALGQKSERRLGPDFRGLVTLSLGHSIGLGLALRRDQDIDISAPNFGHMLHVPGGALCRCGSRGCIEAYAGFYAILRTAFEVPRDTIPAKFVPLQEVDKLAIRARSGERMPSYAFREAGLALGYGLSRLLSLYGHLPISVTGPGARYFDLLHPGLVDGLSEAQVVRMFGVPALSVVSDEPMLVFEGHLDGALTVMDEDLVAGA